MEHYQEVIDGLQLGVTDNFECMPSKLFQLFQTFLNSNVSCRQSKFRYSKTYQQLFILFLFNIKSYTKYTRARTQTHTQMNNNVGIIICIKWVEFV